MKDAALQILQKKVRSRPESEDLSLIKGIYMDIPDWELQAIAESSGVAKPKKLLSQNMMPLEFANQYNKIIDKCKEDDDTEFHNNDYFELGPKITHPNKMRVPKYFLFMRKQHPRATINIDPSFVEPPSFPSESEDDTEEKMSSMQYFQAMKKAREYAQEGEFTTRNKNIVKKAEDNLIYQQESMFRQSSFGQKKQFLQKLCTQLKEEEHKRWTQRVVNGEVKQTNQVDAKDQERLVIEKSLKKIQERITKMKEDQLESSPDGSPKKTGFMFQQSIHFQSRKDNHINKILNSVPSLQSIDENSIMKEAASKLKFKLTSNQFYSQTEINSFSQRCTTEQSLNKIDNSISPYYTHRSQSRGEQFGSSFSKNYNDSPSMILNSNQDDNFSSTLSKIKRNGSQENMNQTCSSSKKLSKFYTQKKQQPDYDCFSSRIIKFQQQEHEHIKPKKQLIKLVPTIEGSFHAQDKKKLFRNKSQEDLSHYQSSNTKDATNQEQQTQFLLKKGCMKQKSNAVEDNNEIQTSKSQKRHSSMSITSNKNNTTIPPKINLLVSQDDQASANRVRGLNANENTKTRSKEKESKSINKLEEQSQNSKKQQQQQSQQSMNNENNESQNSTKSRFSFTSKNMNHQQTAFAYLTSKKQEEY